MVLTFVFGLALMASRLTREEILDDLYRECLKSNERMALTRNTDHFVSLDSCRR